MAQVTIYGLLRQLRSDASAHIQHYHNGKRAKSGRGLAFWFMADGGLNLVRR